MIVKILLASHFKIACDISDQCSGKRINNCCMEYCYIGLVLAPLVLEFTSLKKLSKIVGDVYMNLSEIDRSPQWKLRDI